MSNRRIFIQHSAAAASTLAFPLVGGAQPQGRQGRHPAPGHRARSPTPASSAARARCMALEDINKTGIKSLGGAKLDAMLGDAQSTPQAGTAEIEKMNEAGCSAVVGAFASAICLATTQAAAKYNLPHVVDVGVADQIVQRGLKNTFRFGPGYATCAQVAVNNLHVLNTVAGRPAKTVMIIHEESLFGTGTANLLAQRAAGLRLRGQGSRQARQPHARLQQHRAAHEVDQPRHRDPGQLLQRVRAAGAHDAAAEGGAQGHLLGAGRRGLELQVRQGVPGSGRTASSTATTGSTRRTSAAPSCASAPRPRACSSPTRCS
jgi:hypothetical protein